MSETLQITPLSNESSSSPFILGSLVERHLDEISFIAQVLLLDPISATCDLIYLDDKNIERKVPFSEISLISTCPDHSSKLSHMPLSKESLLQYLIEDSPNSQDSSKENIFLEVRERTRGNFVVADGSVIITNLSPCDEVKEDERFAAGSPLRLVKWLKSRPSGSDDFVQTVQLSAQTRPITAYQKQIQMK